MLVQHYDLLPVTKLSCKQGVGLLPTVWPAGLRTSTCKQLWELPASIAAGWQPSAAWHVLHAQQHSAWLGTSGSFGMLAGQFFRAALPTDTTK